MLLTSRMPLLYVLIVVSPHLSSRRFAFPTLQYQDVQDCMCSTVVLSVDRVGGLPRKNRHCNSKLARRFRFPLHCTPSSGAHRVLQLRRYLRRRRLQGEVGNSVILCCSPGSGSQGQVHKCVSYLVCTYAQQCQRPWSRDFKCCGRVSRIFSPTYQAGCCLCSIYPAFIHVFNAIDYSGAP